MRTTDNPTGPPFRYVERGDKAPCCGCVILQPIASVECDCKCHDSARIFANPMWRRDE